MTEETGRATGGPATAVSGAVMEHMYVTMLRIRLFEEQVAGLLEQPEPEIRCPCHLCIGEEAVAAGVCASLRPDDYVFSTHRSHGHYIAKGGDLRSLMAEILGRVDGCSRGRGGSMHLADPSIGLPGSSAIVAGTVPVAVGAALAAWIRGTDTVSVAFFGDGATNEGVWYESLNFASLRKLPVLFVCENNLYSTHMHVSSTLADTDISRKASMFDMPGVTVDGNDVLQVYRAARKAIEAARRGEGPTLIEASTYRWRGHVGPNYDIDKGLRSKDELDNWMARCPIKTLAACLCEEGIASAGELTTWEEDARREVAAALDFARVSPLPDPEEVTRHVFTVETG